MRTTEDRWCDRDQGEGLRAAARAVAGEREDTDSEHDGDISDVENAGADRADANVDEVDNLSKREPVEKIRGAAGPKQSQCEED